MEQNRERALHLKVAENENEYIGSFSLVHDVYSEMGVMEKKKNGMRVSVFNTLPSTKVLVLRNGREIASTMTLIFDSELGLPSDDLFREEIDAFRRKGLRILEVGAFASRKDVREQNPRIAIELCKAAIGFADYADVDILIAGVNPKYTRIYRKMLGFDFVGEPKEYPKV
ncbi:MAG: N-acyl amino acid synthase FeeM domain-containing protein, partial [Candidatus Muiribacteriaceae bacterium]